MEQVRELLIPAGMSLTVGSSVVEATVRAGADGSLEVVVASANFPLVLTPGGICVLRPCRGEEGA